MISILLKLRFSINVLTKVVMDKHHHRMIIESGTTRSKVTIEKAGHLKAINQNSGL